VTHYGKDLIFSKFAPVRSSPRPMEQKGESP
jgi:hypothetical protein